MKFVIKPARRGRLRRRQLTWRMIAANGEDIGGGETYNNRADIHNAINLIKREAAQAPVMEEQ